MEKSCKNCKFRSHCGLNVALCNDGSFEQWEGVCLEKEIKAIIRAEMDTLYKFSNGSISYGKMAEILSKSILNHLKDLDVIKD